MLRYDLSIHHSTRYTLPNQPPSVNPPAMPELVACPSCGCKTQVADVLLGSSTRCIACGRTFVANVFTEPPRLMSEYPVQSTEEDDAPPPRPNNWYPGRAKHQKPLCPRCHLPVEWEAEYCPHCSHAFDPNDREAPPPWETRRDGEKHRGQLIDTLGTIALVCGVLGSCTLGLGVLAALGTGVPALVMAKHDLERMNANQLDPEGRRMTELGRNKAVVGVVLAVLFGVGFVLFLVHSSS